MTEDAYVDLEIEGVGSKVLLAQIAQEYSSIGIDGVAMAVNDTIRSGARPILLADAIHVEKSDKNFIKEILVGLHKGAEESGCVLISGETGDVPELFQKKEKGFPFDLIVVNLGTASGDEIIRGTDLVDRDTIIGLRSSGIHSNGLTLARKVLLKRWGGLYGQNQKPNNFEKTVLEELLTATRIYSRQVKAVNSTVGRALKAAVHVTGDAYLKLGNLFDFNPNVGFELHDFDIPPIFDLIQSASAKRRGPISDEEMFKTFNMGYGFLLFVDRRETDRCLDILEKEKCDAKEIGKVTANAKKVLIRHRGKKISLR